MQKRSIVILGAGPGGYTAAVRAAQLGATVTIIEENGLGGVCLQSGCIPVKSLLISAGVLETARRADEFGITVGHVGFDYGRIVERKNNIVTLNEDGIAHLFRKHAIRLLRGRGKIAEPGLVIATTHDGVEEAVPYDALIIATGSSSAVPPFITLDQHRIFDCAGALARTELPSSILVLGGGILGCEFASFYRSLGADVTIVEQQSSLMPLWDEALTRRMQSQFRRRGIDIRISSSVTAIHDGSDDTLDVMLSSGDTLEIETCLVAVGRTPNIAGIGLETAGVLQWDSEFRGIQVNDHLMTTAPGIYAIGDVTGIRPLAHVASTQGIAAAEHIMTGKHIPVRYDAVPDCFWAKPELASVGMTEQQVRTDGTDATITRYGYRGLGISHVLGEPDGFIKVVADKQSGRILGVHICGHSAPEMIAEATVVVNNAMSIGDFEEVIHAHPTMGEIVKEAIMSAEGLQIHG